MRRMHRKTENSGFTIVELLIAITILSIVTATVCGFIVVGSKSYASGNSDINVQQESQLALNQMSDVLIDTTRSVNYVGYDASGSPVPVLKDAEFTFAPEDKSLILYNGVEVVDPTSGAKTIEDGNGNKNYHFYWDKSDETLFYAEAEAATGTVPNFSDPGWVVLASHVTEFSVDLTQVEEKRVVQLALTFVDGNKEYVTSNNVTIRNKVGVNDAELDPINRRKTLKVTPRDAGVILEPGETYHFSTPKVTGENVTDRSVKWTLAAPGGNSSSGLTDFTDADNGILYIAKDEPAGTLDVVITTNAEDSDGNHATCTLTVSVKRVSAVTLTKTADEDADNGPLEISVGSAFTIGATIEGVKIGSQCSGCTLDITHDHDAVDWRWSLVSGTGSLEVIDSADCQPSRYRAAAGTTVGTKFRIEATSELSKNRDYADPQVVDGAIILTVAKASDDAEPYGGKLKYGEQTLDEGVREGLPTDYSKYVTAIRVVDNSGKEPDKVLLHYTIGGGNNYRICPDLFDLDLNGSYTFYLQALFPIAEDRYVEGQGGTPDDNETIRQEYFSHLNPSKPYGYVGTRYRHGKVFYAKLDRPKLIYEYNGVRYSGKNITYDTVDIFSVGLGSGIVGEIRPVGYENIVEDNSAWTHITNSLYEGEGSNQSSWKKLYYVDESSIKITQKAEDKKTMDQYSMEYYGSNTLASGSVQIDPKGSMFMKLNNGDHRLEACGEYHIVPGMVYQNLDPGHYEIIGYEGFDFPNLPRELKYYEFDDSTIHVKVGLDFNLELWSFYNGEFTKGKIHFPTPSEAAFSSYFNREVTQWQDAKQLDNFRKLINNSDQITYYKPSSMRCRYVKDQNAYELELFCAAEWGSREEVSVGVFYCKANGSSWERRNKGAYDTRLESGEKIKLGGTAELIYSPWSISGVAYIPLPSDSLFGNVSGGLGFELKKTSQSNDHYPLEWWRDGKDAPEKWNENMRVVCNYNAATDTYTLELYDGNLLGTYTCKSNGTRWIRQ